MLNSRFILGIFSHLTNKKKTIKPTKNIVLVKNGPKLPYFEEFFKLPKLDNRFQYIANIQ
jgi:hypothetical protein